MALSNSQYEHLMRMYEQRQLDNENRLRKRFEEVYANVPQIKELDHRTSELSLSKARKLLDGDDTALASLKEELQQVFLQKKELLAEAGVEEGSIAPAYDTSQTLGIGKECKNPEIAFDFITANLTTEASSYYYEASCMPVRTSVYDLDSVKESAMYETMSEWSEIWEGGLENFFFEPDYNAEFSTEVAEVVQDLIINGGDVKAALDDVVAQYQ